MNNKQLKKLKKKITRRIRAGALEFFVNGTPHCKAMFRYNFRVSICANLIKDL